MTWSWTLTKIGISFSLGAISNNPVGWVIGLPTSQLIKLKNQENLNSSTLTLTDKETAQRWIEVASDYQVGAGMGIAFKGLGAVASEMAKNTLNLGQQAGKAIAENSGKLNAMARELISKGQNLSKIETVIRKADTIHDLEDGFRAFFKLIKESANNANENEFINNACIIIEAQNIIIDEITLVGLTEGSRILINPVRNVILELNRKNIKCFIRYEKNKEKHQRINREINQTLKRVKEIQQAFHNKGNCCESCRFCEKCRFCK